MAKRYYKACIRVDGCNIPVFPERGRTFKSIEEAAQRLVQYNVDACGVVFLSNADGNDAHNWCMTIKL